MKFAIKELKLNSATTVAMFDRAANRINVYFKTKSGRPARKLTSKTGWDIIQVVADENFTSVHNICENFCVAIYQNSISFVWH